MEILHKDIKDMTHSYHQTNIIYRIAKLQSWTDDSKLEILVYKIKVKKYLFLYYTIEEENSFHVTYGTFKSHDNWQTYYSFLY